MSPEEIISSEVQRRSSGKEAGAAELKISHKLRYWPLYVICLGLSLSVAFLYLRYKRPTYVISANFVSKDTEGFYNMQGSGSEKANPLTASQLPAEEPGTIKLRAAILAVVQKLNLTVRYQKKGRLVNLDLYNNTPVQFQLVRLGAPGSTQFDVTIKSKNTYVLKKGGADAGEFAFNRIYTNEIGSWLISKMPAFEKYIGQTIVIQVQDPETTAEGLLSDMQISPVENASNTTKFSIKDKVLERGQATLSQLMGQLNSNLAQEEATESAVDIKLIDESLLAFGDKVDALQVELIALNSAERDIKLSSTATNYLELAKRNGMALNKINFELLALNALEKYLKNGDLTRVPPTSASGLSRSSLRGFVRELIVLQSQRQQLLKTHLKNDPAFNPIKQQAAKIKKSMVQTVLSLKAGLLKRRADLESGDDRAQTILNFLSPEERKLVALRRKQITYENQYAFLLKRKEEASVRRATNVLANETPETSYKVDINQRTTYTWALLCGILIPSFIVAGRSIQSSKNHHKTT